MEDDTERNPQTKQEHWLFTTCLSAEKVEVTQRRFAMYPKGPFGATFSGLLCSVMLSRSYLS